jgi:hypothetical protein
MVIIASLALNGVHVGIDAFLAPGLAQLAIESLQLLRVDQCLFIRALLLVVDF